MPHLVERAMRLPIIVQIKSYLSHASRAFLLILTGFIWQSDCSLWVQIFIAFQVCFLRRDHVRYKMIFAQFFSFVLLHRCANTDFDDSIQIEHVL